MCEYTVREVCESMSLHGHPGAYSALQGPAFEWSIRCRFCLGMAPAAVLAGLESVHPSMPYRAHGGDPRTVGGFQANIPGHSPGNLRVTGRPGKC
jgi:hypothetical protein